MPDTPGSLCRVAEIIKNMMAISTTSSLTAASIPERFFTSLQYRNMLRSLVSGAGEHLPLPDLYEKRRVIALAYRSFCEILIYYAIASSCGETLGEPQGTGNDAADGIKDSFNRRYHIR